MTRSLIKIKENNYLKFLFLFPLLIWNCSSPNEPDTDLITLGDPPVITGVHVTTLEYPDGTGEKLGNPSYIVKNINVFPNPARINYIDYPGDEVRPLKWVTFTHLPSEAKIIIVKGKSLNVEGFFNHSSKIWKVTSFIKKIRILEKSDPAQFYTWNLKDENDEYISSGLYRAYISGENIPSEYYLDLYIEIGEPVLRQY